MGIQEEVKNNQKNLWGIGERKINIFYYWIEMDLSQKRNGSQDVQSFLIQLGLVKIKVKQIRITQIRNDWRWLDLEEESWPKFEFNPVQHQR